MSWLLSNILEYFLPKIDENNIICVNDEILNNSFLHKEFKSIGSLGLLLKSEIPIIDNYLIKSNFSSKEIVKLIQELDVKNISVISFQNNIEIEFKKEEFTFLELLDNHLTVFTNNDIKLKFNEFIKKLIETIFDDNTLINTDFIISYLNSINIDNKQHTHYKFSIINIKKIEQNKFYLRLYGAKFSI